jgi:hypothetical protein
MSEKMEWTKHQNTNNLILRWFGNMCEIPAHWFLKRCLDLDEIEHYNLKYKIYGRASNILYKPVLKWGTYYSIDNFSAFGSPIHPIEKDPNA